MNNEEKEKLFADFDELKFNSKDRKEVFNKLHKQNVIKFSFHRSRPALLTSFLGLIGAAILFFALSSPNVFIQENQEIRSTSTTETIKTGFLLIKNENHRTSLNLVLSYNPNTRSLNVLSIPRDLYVPILDADGKNRGEDKVMHAFTFGGTEGVQQTLTNYFHVPHDFYSELTEDELIGFIDEIGGITPSSSEQALSGKDVLTSLLERNQATEDVLKMAEKEHYQLLTKFLKRAIEQPEESKIIGWNFPEEVEINTVEIAEMIELERIDGVFYYILEEEELEQVKDSLKH